MWMASHKNSSVICLKSASVMNLFCIHQSCSNLLAAFLQRSLCTADCRSGDRVALFCFLHSFFSFSFYLSYKTIDFINTASATMPATTTTTSSSNDYATANGARGMHQPTAHWNATCSLHFHISFFNFCNINRQTNSLFLPFACALVSFLCLISFFAAVNKI